MNFDNTRWKQRYENLQKANQQLKDFIQQYNTQKTNIHRAGLIQAFEFTFELAWKTLKDYLKAQEVTERAEMPKEVIKQAFHYKIITNAHLWLEMLKARNQTSHTYNDELATRIAEETIKNHSGLIDELCKVLAKEK